MEKTNLQKSAMDQLRRKMAEDDSIGAGNYTLTANGIGADSLRAIMRLGGDGRYILELTGDTGQGATFEAQGDGQWTYSRAKRLLTLDGYTIVKRMMLPGIGAVPIPTGRTPTYFSIFIEEHSNQRWKGTMKDHHSGTSYALTLER